VLGQLLWVSHCHDDEWVEVETIESIESTRCQKQKNKTKQNQKELPLPFQ